MQLREGHTAVPLATLPQGAQSQPRPGFEPHPSLAGDLGKSPLNPFLHLESRANLTFLVGAL